jgi:hypothetical protein
MSQSSAEQQQVGNTTPNTESDFLIKSQQFPRIAELLSSESDDNELLSILKDFFGGDYRLFFNFIHSGLDRTDLHAGRIQHVIIPKILNINFFRMMIDSSLFGTIFVNEFCTFINKYISMTGQSMNMQGIQHDFLTFRIKLGKEKLCDELSQEYIRSTIHNIRGYDSDEEEEEERKFIRACFSYSSDCSDSDEEKEEDSCFSDSDD